MWLALTNLFKNPPKTTDEYLDTLLKSGLKQTVAMLQSLCVEL